MTVAELSKRLSELPQDADISLGRYPDDKEVMIWSSMIKGEMVTSVVISLPKAIEVRHCPYIPDTQFETGQG